MVAVQPERTGLIVSGLGHAMLLAWGLLTFSSAPKPFDMDMADSVPVEVISDAPSQAMRGVQTAEKKETPQRVIDRQAAEEKETEDEVSPVQKQAVQNSIAPPPPAPRPKPPEPPQPEQKVAALPPPPAPAARPKPEEIKPDTDKEAELQAKKKLEEQKRVEQEKQEAERKKLEEAKKVAEEKRKADEKKKAEDDKKKAEEAKKLAEAKAEKERQDKANARTFDPKSIASRLNSDKAVNDRRDAARTEATGSTAPTRTASLGTATGNAARLSASEIDALRSQVQACWNVPAAAMNAQDMTVRVTFSLNPDGTVSGRPQVTNGRGDPAFQAAAASAVRAIMQCGSNGRRFNLPAAKYDAWREVAITFDPRDMLR